MLSKLVIASHNKGKITEISELLQPFNVQVTGGTDYNLEEPEETEDTFTGNALLKARYFYEHTGASSLADDSGLVVPALDGAPGIYSARWAEQANGKRDFSKAMQRVEQELGDKTPDAYFTCALALIHDGKEIVVEGKVHGTLRFPATGEEGFGYDPIFVANDYDQTFAEIDPIIKQKISHRADAFSQLISILVDHKILQEAV